MNFIYIREFYDVSDLSKSQIYVLHLDDKNNVTQKIPSDEKQAAAVGATIKNVASPGTRFILIDEKGNPYVDPNMEASLAAQAAMQAKFQLTMQAQTLLDNGYKNIHRNSNPDLGLNGVGRSSEESLDAEVLFYPFEE